MEKNDFDARIPNRIIPPQMSIQEARRGEYDSYRSVRPTFGVQSSSVLSFHGGTPIERGSYPRYSVVPQHTETYNGPVLANGSTRKSGFDRSGEEVMNVRRQPLLKTFQPVLAVEHIGGDMDISRSRSTSPVERRSIRDTRKSDQRPVRNERGSSRRSRSRSRSRSRGGRHEERYKPRERELLRTPSNNQMRDGIIYSGDNFYEFLNTWLGLINDEVEKFAERDVHGRRRIRENLTNASDTEKEKIVLPPDFVQSDRKRMVHCDMTIDGLPAAIFFGSGYGPRDYYAKNAAAKDLVDKCHRIGVISSELHAAIANRQDLDESFHKHFATQISKAVNAVLLLINKMSFEHLPPGFMSLRQLDPEVIDRFKHLLRMVMLDVYYQGVESPAAVVPKALETLQSSRSCEPSGSPYQEREKKTSRSIARSPEPRKPVRSNAEELEAMRKAMEDKMKEELAKREQEIRKRVIEEERAKIRAEMERAQKIEQMMHDQQQYEIRKAKEKQELEERQIQMSKQVEQEFNDMVSTLERRFAEVREKRLNHVLEMIYSSSTFKAIQMFSGTQLNFDQMQKMVIDLKQLIESIELSTQAAEQYSRGRQEQPSSSSYPYRYNVPSIPDIMVSPGYGTSPSGYQMSSGSSITTSIYPASSTSPGYLPSSTTSPRSSSSSRKEEVHRLTVGDMRLRALTPSEKRHLKEGDKVIAQDMKTGNWSLAYVSKIRDDRVTLTAGSNTLKKYMDEIYREDKGPR